MRFVSSDSRYFYFPFSSSGRKIFGDLDNFNCNNQSAKIVMVELSAVVQNLI